MPSAGRPCGRPSGGRCGQALRSVRRLALGVLVIGSLPAGAQRYGQWWWEGSTALTRRHYENRPDAAPSGSIDERDLDLSLGVNGFILHPELARFRVGLEASLSSYNARRQLDARRWGADCNLSLVPRGAYPLSLYASRRRYDYSKLTQDDPLDLLGAPESAWSAGGRLRLRRGALRGARLGYDRTSLGFVSAARDASRREHAFVEWDRSSRRFERRAHLDRRTQDFGVVDFRLRDWTATYDQRGPLDPRWRWEMFATGIHRSLDYRASASAFQSVRTSQRLLRAGERDSLLELSYEGGLSRGSGLASQGHLLLGRYRLRPRPAWTLAPYAGYGLQRGEGRHAHAPQFGLAATWRRRAGAFDLSSSGALGYLALLHGGGSDSTLTVDFGLGVGQGGDSGLRRELDLSWARARLRLAGESLPGLPDLGASLAGTGTEGLLSGRLTLQRRWRSWSLSAVSEAARRDLSAVLSPQAARVESWSETLQLGASRLTLTGNLARSRVRGATPQTLDSWYAALSWRPARLLSLQGSYRSDLREPNLAPDVRGRRYEALADAFVGAFVVRGQAFETRERSGVASRLDRGFVFSVSRRFAGWLPFVTGPPEGGVIR